MRRIAVLWSLLAAGMLSGCGPAENATKLLAPNTDPGRTWLKLTGTGAQLKQQKRIDEARVFVMPDKAAIDTWIVKARPEGPGKARGTVVLLHGLSESKANYLGVAERLARMGYDVILPDLRTHGLSTGRYVTYGAREKHDVKAIVDALVAEQAVCPVIYACGCTLGGAVAIQYAAIDERVKGVMAIAPYKDLEGIAQRMINPLGLMSKADFDASIKAAGEMGQFDPADASAVEAAGRLRCPALLVHGLLDLSVPVEHSEAIYKAAAGPKRLMIVSPGPEQLALAVVWEDWLAEKIDSLRAPDALGPVRKP